MTAAERGSSCPRVANYVHLHARRRPRHVAVMRNGVAVTYAALDRDLRAMTQALAQMGVTAGNIAAVGHDDLYIQLLLVFGFDSLGVVTGSFRAAEEGECAALLAQADFVIGSAEMPGPPVRRGFVVTAAWLETVFAAPLPHYVPVAKAGRDEPAIIVRSSGTTGYPKRMLLTHGVLNARLAKQREIERGIAPASRARHLVTMHFSAASTYRCASNCLRLGATFMFETSRIMAEVLPELRPTHMRILPYQLRRLLGFLPGPGPSGPLLPALTLQSAGAKLPDDLRVQALRKLAGRVVDYYGCNEISAIGTIGAGNTINFVTGMQAEVVDQNQRRLAPGEIGFLRVRGAGMITGYIGDPAAGAAMFRDGWLYPGDLAMRGEDGRFRLVGRRNDVLNLGGLKVAAEELESRILANPRVRDVAVVQRNDDNLSLPVTVFAVVRPATDLARLAHAIRPIINFPFHLRVAAEIPRTQGGKVRRLAVQGML